MASQTDHGGPYRPTTWALGGLSSKSVDIPVTSVFLVLYVVGAAIHMTILQLNTKRNHKFLFSGAMFGFCMSRITTCCLRLASVMHPTNLSLAIAAAVFVAAATLILFIFNLMWAQRILRALHPHIGWHRSLSISFRAIYVLTFFTLVMNITVLVQSWFTLRPRTKHIDRSVQLYGTTYMATLSSLPLFIVALALALPRRSEPQRFGSGTLRTKIIVLLTGTTLLSVGAWYRCGTLWMTPVPMSQPIPTYFHKACFYIFDFTVEILTVYLYAIARVDLRFHVPDGSKGSYEILPTKGNNQSINSDASEEREAMEEKKEQIAA